MAINRFYNPQRGGYQSQFVEDKLPVELMASALTNRQKKEDAARADAAKLGEWTQNSIGEYDRNYVKSYETKLKDFAGNYLDVEMSSPEQQRQYRQFVRETREDEGLKKVQASYDWHQDIMKRKEELNKKGLIAEAQALQYDYDRRYQEYTKKGGLGYTGDVQVVGSTVSEGIDMQKAGEELFDDMKANGYETANKLTNDDLSYAYSSSYEGVDGKRLSAQANRMLEYTMDRPFGIQARKQYLMDNGIADYDLEKMSQEDRLKVEEGARKETLKQLVSISKEFEYKKTSNDKAEAMNKQSDRGYAEKKETEAAIVQQTLDEITPNNITNNWDSKISNVNTELTGSYAAMETAKKALALDPNNKYLQAEISGHIARIKELNETKEFVEKDKELIYNKFFELNPGAKHLMEAVEKARENLKTTQKTRDESRMLGYSPGAIMSNTADNLSVYYAEKELKKAQNNFQVGAGKQWTDFYSTTGMMTRTISAPLLSKGSASKTEERLINADQSAYTFYDTRTGRAIPSTGSDGERLLENFVHGSYTEGDYRETGRVGRSGTAMKTVAYQDGDDIKYKKVPVSVVVVPVNGNTEKSVNLSVAREYVKAAQLNRESDPASYQNAVKGAMIMSNTKTYEQLKRIPPGSNAIVTFNNSEMLSPQLKNLDPNNTGGQVKVIVEVTKGGTVYAKPVVHGIGTQTYQYSNMSDLFFSATAGQELELDDSPK